MNVTHQQNIQLYQVVKAQQGKWVTKIQIQQKFSHLLRELEEMGTIAS
jgi:hypothetical protein